MKAKNYWLLSDGKTVREITWEQWRDMVNEDYDRKNKRTLMRVWDSEVYFRKGKSSFWVDRRQLEKVLVIE